jgi:hypothetical protein
MRTGLVVTILALIALYFYNPTMADFRVFVQAQSEEILLHEAGESEIGRMLSEAGSQLAARYIDRITERRDYFFFSTYTVDLDGADRDEEEWRFLGIGAHFMEIKRPKSLREREKR